LDSIDTQKFLCRCLRFLPFAMDCQKKPVTALSYPNYLGYPFAPRSHLNPTLLPHPVKISTYRGFFHLECRADVARTRPIMNRQEHKHRCLIDLDIQFPQNPIIEAGDNPPDESDAKRNTLSGNFLGNSCAFFSFFIHNVVYATLRQAIGDCQESKNRKRRNGVDATRIIYHEFLEIRVIHWIYSRETGK